MPIATATARAFRTAGSRTRRRMRACSTTCWPASAALSSWDRRRTSTRAPIITRLAEIEVLRLLSFLIFLATWWIAALLAGSTKLPAPPAVMQVVITEAESGALFFNIGVTLARVALAFTLAITIGIGLGYLMGRVRLANRLGDPWLVLLLNLPALVIIVLAYIWAGLTEIAALAAVVLNKLPLATVTVREGTRALDRNLDEMAAVFRMSRWKRLRHVVLPQLSPYLAAASRSGLSLVWKIVLIVELLGRPNGVGFEIGV